MWACHEAQGLSPWQPFCTCSRFLLAVLARSSCHSKKTCHANLVIARRVEYTTRQSHCKQHLFLDYFATLVMTKARWPHRLKRLLAMTIHTTFAMTILNLPVTCHANFVIAMEWKDFSAKPKCEPATSHSCGVVEAISLQATLVFGLLRYARNDKSKMAASS